MSLLCTKLVLHSLTERITERGLRPVAIARRYWPASRAAECRKLFDPVATTNIGDWRRNIGNATDVADGAYSYVLDKEQRTGPSQTAEGAFGQKGAHVPRFRFVEAKNLTAAAVTVALAGIVPMAPRNRRCVGNARPHAIARPRVHGGLR